MTRHTQASTQITLQQRLPQSLSARHTERHVLVSGPLSFAPALLTMCYEARHDGKKLKGILTGSSQKRPPLQSCRGGGGSRANWPVAVQTQQGNPPELTKPFQHRSSTSPHALSLSSIHCKARLCRQKVLQNRLKHSKTDLIISIFITSFSFFFLCFFFSFAESFCCWFSLVIW